MRVKIDQDLCTGHGRCQAVAGAVYSLDSNGYNAGRGKTLDITPGQEALARKGARLCPERAISIVEEPVVQE